MSAYTDSRSERLKSRWSTVVSFRSNQLRMQSATDQQDPALPTAPSLLTQVEPSCVGRYCIFPASGVSAELWAPLKQQLQECPANRSMADVSNTEPQGEEMESLTCGC